MEGKNDNQKKLDVRTMAKDLTKVRERATEKQRDKIVGLEPEPVLPTASVDKISPDKNLELQKRLEETRRQREELERKNKELAERKKEEESILKQAQERAKKEQEEKIKAEERLAKEQIEMLKKQEEAKKILEEENRKREEEIQKKIKEEEWRRAMQEEIQRKAQEELEREESAQKAQQEKELELLIKKQEEEKSKLVSRETELTQKDQEKARITELLNKIKSPVDRIREKMATRKTEKELSEAKSKPEGAFFKRIFTREGPDISREPEKTPEQLLIEKLQKIDAQREKERKERESFLRRITDGKIETRSQEPTVERFPLMAKMPLKKIPTTEKIFWRIVLIGFLIGLWAIIFTFWYWVFVAQKEPAPAPPENTQQQTPPKPPVLSAAAIPTQSTKVVAFNTVTELKTGLTNLFNEQYPAGQIIRIAFGDKATNQYLTLQQFFETMGASAPLAFFQKLDTNFTFFLYSSKGYNRFGVIIKFNNQENFPAAMKGWEPSMEDNLESLFSYVGKTNPAIVPYFRSGEYPIPNGYNYRFQTFSAKDLGICYVTVGNYFVLTSSMESLNKVIDLLK